MFGRGAERKIWWGEINCKYRTVPYIPPSSSHNSITMMYVCVSLPSGKQLEHDVMAAVFGTTFTVS